MRPFRSLISAIALLLPAISDAQPSSLVNPAQYLFPDFTRSAIAMKTGRDLYVMLNYNVVTEKMVFLQKGEIYDMVEYANIDTAYLHGRKFIPSGKVFHEVSVEGPYTLLIQHRGKIQSPARPAAYGGTSDVSSSTYINNLQLGNDVYRLKNEPGLIIKPDPVYYLRSDVNLGSFQSSKQLYALLPGMAGDIRKYIKQNRLQFDRPEDVTRLIEYCNSLKR